MLELLCKCECRILSFKQMDNPARVVSWSSEWNPITLNLCVANQIYRMNHQPQKNSNTHQHITKNWKKHQRSRPQRVKRFPDLKSTVFNNDQGATAHPAKAPLNARSTKKLSFKGAVVFSKAGTHVNSMGTSVLNKTVPLSRSPPPIHLTFPNPRLSCTMSTVVVLVDHLSHMFLNGSQW